MQPNPHLIDAGVVAAATAGWYTLYALARLATRPPSVRPAPATQEMGTEPPAIASMLVNRWELTEDAAESTLLDLAARGYLEFRQPSNDPMQTTIHLREPPGDGDVARRCGRPAGGPDVAAATALLPFEQQVLDRIRELAVSGVVPVTALTFRDAKQTEAWNKRLRVAVIAEARRLGLSQRRFHPAIVAFLTVAGAGVAIPLYWAIAHWAALNPSNDSDNPLANAILVPIMPAIFVFAGLATYAARYPGERDTPDGRKVAAHWLGLRTWLRGDDGFAELPPAAVAVWDRYLAYGAAVGATRVASAVLDLGMGNRKLVWSSFGGAWHRVRVRYPRMWPRYGQRAWRLTRQAILALLIGIVLLKFVAKPRELLTDPLDLKQPALKWFDLGENLVILLGVFLVVLGAYKLIRNLVDLATQKVITGQVLWVQSWSTKGSQRSSEEICYFAVDDASRDRTTAWAKPARLGGASGDTVRFKVRPWSRRVIELAVTEQATRAVLSGPATFEELDKPATTRSSRPQIQLLVPDEVSPALGLPVRHQTVAVPGPFGMQQFTGPDGRTLLLVQYARGPLTQWVWRANARGTAVPGVGDGAFVNGNRAALKVGDTIVLLTLMNGAEERTSAFPALLSSVAARIPQQR